MGPVGALQSTRLQVQQPQVAYTSVSFTRPAAANFAFTPPAEATVVQEQIQSGKLAGSGKTTAGAAQGSDLLDGST